MLCVDQPARNSLCDDWLLPVFEGCGARRKSTLWCWPADQAATLQAELLYHSLDDEKYKAGWSSPAKTLIQVSTLHSRPVLEVLPGAFRMSVDPQN